MKIESLFQIKIIEGDNVYLLLNEADKVANGLISSKYSDYIIHNNLIDRDVVLQDNFNRVVEKEPEVANNAHLIEITKIDELRCRLNIHMSLLPLIVSMNKNLYERLAESEGCSLNEYANKHLLQERINDDVNEMIKKESCSYNEEIKLYKKNMKVVKEYGLSIQCLTYIKDGTLYFDSFIVGKGIFYLIPNEELEYWDISKTNNGLKITDGYGEEIIFEGSIDQRDYKQFNVLDNLVHVVSTKKPEHDSVDTISYYDGGVSVILDSEVVFRLLNPIMFSDIIFFDGIVDISHHKIVSGLDK